jgi:hypothetical protein
MTNGSLPYLSVAYNCRLSVNILERASYRWDLLCPHAKPNALISTSLCPSFGFPSKDQLGRYIGVGEPRFSDSTNDVSTRLPMPPQLSIYVNGIFECAWPSK